MSPDCSISDQYNNYNNSDSASYRSLQISRVTINIPHIAVDELPGDHSGDHHHHAAFLKQEECYFSKLIQPLQSVVTRN